MIYCHIGSKNHNRIRENFQRTVIKEPNIRYKADEQESNHSLSTLFFI